MKFLAVIFALFGLSCALLQHRDPDDPEYQEFEARLHKMATEHAKMEGHGAVNPPTREEIEAALDQFLPSDPEQREMAMGELFMSMMMDEGHHKMGQGHHKMGKGHGHRTQPHPRSFDPFHEREDEEPFTR